MSHKITIELDDETDRLLGIYKEAMKLESREEAINQIVKRAKSIILKEAK